MLRLFLEQCSSRLELFLVAPLIQNMLLLGCSWLQAIRGVAINLTRVCFFDKDGLIMDPLTTEIQANNITTLTKKNGAGVTAAIFFALLILLFLYPG